MANNPQDDLMRLRKRLVDLQAVGLMDPKSFGTYQQTLLHIWQEVDRRRQTCLQQAEALRLQAAAAEAQSHAFGALGSIMYNIVNGFVEADEKRVREEAAKAAEKEQTIDEGTEPSEGAS